MKIALLKTVFSGPLTAALSPRRAVRLTVGENRIVLRNRKTGIMSETLLPHTVLPAFVKSCAGTPARRPRHIARFR